MSYFDEYIPAPQPSSRERIKQVIDHLPVLVEGVVTLEDACPICLNTFGSIFEDTSVDPQYRGVTLLEGCGHFFCRKDLIQWIRDRHGSCPTCRHVFLDVQPLADNHPQAGLAYIDDDDEEYEEEVDEVEGHWHEEWFTEDEQDLMDESDFDPGEVDPDFDLGEVDPELAHQWEDGEAALDIDEVGVWEGALSDGWGGDDNEVDPGRWSPRSSRHLKLLIHLFIVFLLFSSGTR
ncbi:hypothetical protein BDN72DRAFT_359258 [Pluteus cervinus]|uniref:Uncharacterized protein n=1 Tax=Pluteus cervinus TaxID=181527 RepID=A0ACD3BE07_9AGAR|nr:hypothetical protein BDN72DRAFT_359258 [Pluteus cervinus]